MPALSKATRRFTGKMLDPESGLYYYGGRYYDPELGRFISPDPFVGQPDDPQNPNRYSYVVNNPVNNIDPDGYFHQVKKKKKKGGFFNSVFGKILRIIFDIGLIFVGLPPGADFAFAGFGAFADLIQTATSFINLGGNGGPPGGPGAPDFGIDLRVSGLLESFFSPALQLAAETACELCPDSRFDLLRLLLGTVSAGDDFPGTSRPPIILAGGWSIFRGTRPPAQRYVPREAQRAQRQAGPPEPRPANRNNPNQPENQFRDKLPQEWDSPDPIWCAGPTMPGCGGAGGVLPPSRVPGGGQNPRLYPIPDLVPDPRL